MENSTKELQDRREMFYLDCIKDFMSQMVTKSEMVSEEIAAIVVSTEHRPNGMERSNMMRYAIKSAKELQNILFKEDGTLRTPEESYAVLEEAEPGLKEEDEAQAKAERVQRFHIAGRRKRGIYEAMTARMMEDSSYF